MHSTQVALCVQVVLHRLGINSTSASSVPFMGFKICPMELTLWVKAPNWMCGIVPLAHYNGSPASDVGPFWMQSMWRCEFIIFNVNSSARRKRIVFLPHVVTCRASLWRHFTGRRKNSCRTIQLLVRAMISILVGNEIDDQNENDVDDALSDDAVHLDLFQSRFTFGCQLLGIWTIGDCFVVDMRRSSTLQNFCQRSMNNEFLDVTHVVCNYFPPRLHRFWNADCPMDT